MQPSVERVQNALRALGFQGNVMELEASTRTAVEAAQAAGCQVGQIVKSLIFQLQKPGEPGTIVLILVSGANRVHEKHLGQRLGGVLGRADADAVRAVTGYAIGGVPPVGHASPLPTYIDEDLLQYSIVWAAAGSPNAIFDIVPSDLVRISGGTVLPVT